MTDYIDQWVRFRRLRSAWLVLFVFEVGPFNNLVHPLLRRLLPWVSDAALTVGPEFLCLVGLALIGRELFYWKCPRCAKPFAGGRKVMDSVRTCLDWLRLPKKCSSCGLPKYANSPSGEAIGADSVR